MRPRIVEEVLATIEACRATGTPLTSRGAGTSIAGNAVGTGVVLDFSRHLNRVHEIDVEARTARVDPGTVHAVLQRAATRSGLRFGPDPSTHTRCTVGGMIGNNACGSRALAYGRTSDNVVGLDAVTMAGEQLTSAPTRPRRRRSIDCEIVVAETWGRSVPSSARFGRQVSGYSLEHLLPESGFDVATFMAGTEGTLATLTSATVRLVEDPAHRLMLVLGYGVDGRGGRRRAGAARFGPTACEGLDSRIVNVVRAHGGTVPDLPRGQGWLFVEISGADAAEIADTVDKAAAASSAIDSRIVTDARRTGRAVADPRGGRRPRDSHAARARRSRGGRTPPFRRSGSAPTCASWTSCSPSTGSTACRTATSATAACTSASTSRSTIPAGTRCSATSSSRRRRWCRPSAGRCRVSTATAEPAPSCCR